MECATQPNLQSNSLASLNATASSRQLRKRSGYVSNPANKRRQTNNREIRGSQSNVTYAPPGMRDSRVSNARNELAGNCQARASSTRQTPERQEHASHHRPNGLASLHPFNMESEHLDRNSNQENIGTRRRPTTPFDQHENVVGMPENNAWLSNSTAEEVDGMRNLIFLCYISANEVSAKWHPMPG